MIGINIDISDLLPISDLEREIRDALNQAEKEVGMMAHARALELAHARLKSRRQPYIDALSVHEEDGTVILQLDASAMWIEEGLPKHSMLDYLLTSPKAKMAKDGSRYLIVPFHHGPGKGESNTPASTLQLVDAVKHELKRRKIPFAKIERDDQGRPKLGRLHRFDLTHAPVKTHHGPGQGWGPIGAVRQGPNRDQATGPGGKKRPGGGGTPFLAGVSIYQHMVGGQVRRSIMTFRIASSKHLGTDRWQHPGLPGAHILDEVVEWAERELDSRILPAILEKLSITRGT